MFYRSKMAAMATKEIPVEEDILDNICVATLYAGLFRIFRYFDHCAGRSATEPNDADTKPATTTELNHAISSLV